ncbi:MAG: insulinase family protein, partial [Bdellovibrionales bacterium]|nr:insulinase family protein [Bdellovibrionales bacterium]
MITIPEFKTIQSAAIAEISGTATLLVHEKTGTELLYVRNDDENKVFGITLATPPTDSTGLPHIMEHSVLCGSKNYPLKDPFVELLKGSLNTFLNAFTYPDKTCYPVASQNHKDFMNLMRVYLDAVFFPLIPEEVLKQEGWHYELENKEAPLEYKGVVFNEMKGVYSDPVDMVYEYAQESLFPDTIYSLSSGGDPKVIPQLSYQQFKKFHEDFYHPSNARIYLYGDVNEDECFDVIKEYLNQFEQKDLNIEVPLQPTIPNLRLERKEYDAGGGDEAKTSMVTLNWLLPEVSALNERMAITVLNYILLGSSASPLKKALIDSGLGESLIGGGFHTEIRQFYFSTGLKGIKEEDVDKVQALIEDTLASLVKDGIEQEMIEAAINIVEFSYRENNTGGFPRGLALMLRALNTWLYGHDPLEQFRYEDALATLKSNTEVGSYFEGLIQKYLLDNKHRTRILHVPRDGVAAEQEEAEKKKLAEIKAAMWDEELERIIQEAKDLKQFQEEGSSPEDEAKLPFLAIEDLDRANKLVPGEHKAIAATDYFTHDLNTNGICYLDFAFDMARLPFEYVPFLPIYTRALFDMGTKNHDFVSLSPIMDKETGGIGASVFLTNKPQSIDPLRFMLVRGKAVVDKVPALLDITQDILLNIVFDDKQRF